MIKDDTNGRTPEQGGAFLTVPQTMGDVFHPEDDRPQGMVPASALLHLVGQLEPGAPPGPWVGGDGGRLQLLVIFY